MEAGIASWLALTKFLESHPSPLPSCECNPSIPTQPTHSHKKQQKKLVSASKLKIRSMPAKTHRQGSFRHYEVCFGVARPQLGRYAFTFWIGCQGHSLHSLHSKKNSPFLTAPGIEEFILFCKLKQPIQKYPRIRILRECVGFLTTAWRFCNQKAPHERMDGGFLPRVFLQHWFSRVHYLQPRFGFQQKIKAVMCNCLGFQIWYGCVTISNPAPFKLSRVNAALFS